jgi:hypothetical protein
MYVDHVLKIAVFVAIVDRYICTKSLRSSRDINYLYTGTLGKLLCEI